jgi:hypothetical protein
MILFPVFGSEAGAVLGVRVYAILSSQVLGEVGEVTGLL